MTIVIIGTLSEYDLIRVKLPANSILVGVGRPVTENPEFAIGPDGKLLLPIVKVKLAALVVPEWEVEVKATMLAEYLVGPDDKTLLPIVQVATYPEYLPSTKLEVKPASTKAMDAKVEMCCPVCKTKQVMEGFVVWSPDWLENISVQCSNCATCHWIESKKVRQIVEEFGTNRPVEEKMSRATMEIVCPLCNPDKKKLIRGWLLVSPPNYPNLLIQCSNCHTYRWIESPMMRKWAEENGTNMDAEAVELDQTEETIGGSDDT